MSIKPAKNPLPPVAMRLLRALLHEYGADVEEKQIAFLDEVGDEYATFAVLYVKEP